VLTTGRGKLCCGAALLLAGSLRSNGVGADAVLATTPVSCPTCSPRLSSPLTPAGARRAQRARCDALPAPPGGLRGADARGDPAGAFLCQRGSYA
jgi:hypothetical protein